MHEALVRNRNTPKTWLDGDQTFGVWRHNLSGTAYAWLAARTSDINDAELRTIYSSMRSYSLLPVAATEDE